MVYELLRHLKFDRLQTLFSNTVTKYMYTADVSVIQDTIYGTISFILHSTRIFTIQFLILYEFTRYNFWRPTRTHPRELHEVYNTNFHTGYSTLLFKEK